MNKRLLGILTILLALTASNCQEKGHDKIESLEQQRDLTALSLVAESGKKLEINGYYDDGFYFGGTFTALTDKVVINADGYGTGSFDTIDPFYTSSKRIIEFSNSQNFLYYQNESAAFFNPNLYGKIVWTEKSSTYCPGQTCLLYCTVLYDAATLADAKASTVTADPADPTNTGCGGFAWNKLTLRTDNNTWN